jgi:hypothetical protein
MLWWTFMAFKVLKSKIGIDNIRAAKFSDVVSGWKFVQNGRLNICPKSFCPEL